MKVLKSVFSEKQLISSAHTDFTRCLSLGALVDLHIQIAWHHAEHLGYGKDFLHENQLVWMLSRFHLQIDRYPEWNKEIRLESWPKGIRRLFYLRDFAFRDENNDPVSRATSEWLIINWPSKRPKLYHPEHNIFNENLDRHALQGEVPVLSTPAGQAEVFSNRVVYSDIDLNQHLTTTRYIEWMLDCFDLDYLRNHRCRELVLNFLKEVPFGSDVEIRRFPAGQPDTFIFEYYLRENTSLCFRGSLHFIRHNTP